MPVWPTQEFKLESVGDPLPAQMFQRHLRAYPNACSHQNQKLKNQQLLPEGPQPKASSPPPKTKKPPLTKALADSAREGGEVELDRTQPGSRFAKAACLVSERCSERGSDRFQGNAIRSLNSMFYSVSHGFHGSGRWKIEGQPIARFSPVLTGLGASTDVG